MNGDVFDRSFFVACLFLFVVNIFLMPISWVWILVLGILWAFFVVGAAAIINHFRAKRNVEGLGQDNEQKNES